MCSTDLLLLGDPSSAIPISPLPMSEIAVEGARPPKRVIKICSLAPRAAALSRRPPDVLIPNFPDLSNLQVAGAAAHPNYQKRSTVHGGELAHNSGNSAGAERGEAQEGQREDQHQQEHQQGVDPPAFDYIFGQCPAADDQHAAPTDARAPLELTTPASADDAEPEPVHSALTPAARDAAATEHRGSTAFAQRRSQCGSHCSDSEQIHHRESTSISGGATGAECAHTGALPAASSPPSPQQRMPPDTFTVEHLPESVVVEERCRTLAAATRADIRAVLLSSFATPCAQAAPNCTAVTATAPTCEAPSGVADSASVHRTQTIAAACGSPLAQEVQMKERMRPMSATPFHKRDRYWASTYTRKVRAAVRSVQCTIAGLCPVCCLAVHTSAWLTMLLPLRSQPASGAIAGCV